MSLGSGTAQPVARGGTPPRPRVLVVEDEPAVARVMAALQAAGMTGFIFTQSEAGLFTVATAFGIGFSASGNNRITLSAAGFVERQTGIQAPSLDLRLSLIPADGFDLAPRDPGVLQRGVDGDAATIVVWSPDYDGKGKALVRLSDGSEAIVGASRIAFD